MFPFMQWSVHVQTNNNSWQLLSLKVLSFHCFLLWRISWFVQKYKVVNEDTNMISEPSSPQSSTRSRSPSPDDILERVAADVKEYERENLNTFEASIKAKHNLIAQEKDGKVLLKWLYLLAYKANWMNYTIRFVLRTCSQVSACIWLLKRYLRGLRQDIDYDSTNVWREL